jgi:cation diffusion facilitator family transporter
MTTPDISHLRYDHQYSTGKEQRNERRTLWVILLSSITMLVEIAAGYVTHSVALLADGWHMATDVFALSITVFAYIFARRNARNPHYSFGTGKVNALGGFAGGVALTMVALIVAGEALTRLYAPEPILYNEAITVAALGLCINILSAFMLKNGHHHHGECPGHHDHNLTAAYMHVLTDALTSVLAIIALVLGKYYGWLYLDAGAGLAGAALIGYWSLGLVRKTSTILLDRTPDNALELEIRNIMEQQADAHIIDLHLWQLAANHYAAIISIATASPHPPLYYKELLSSLALLSHITVEVHSYA